MSKEKTTTEKLDELWGEITPDDHLKQITGKDYGGLSVRPHYLVQRATEVFGPIGLGWGFEDVENRTETFGDAVLWLTKVRVWWTDIENDAPGTKSEVFAWGGTKIAYQTSKGYLKVDEDAPKKSVTDGLTKALSYLGFASDIHLGKHDGPNAPQRDSKYESSEPPAQQPARQPAPKAPIEPEEPPPAGAPDWMSEPIDFGKKHPGRSWLYMLDNHRDYLEWMAFQMDAKGDRGKAAHERANSALEWDKQRTAQLGDDEAPF